MKTGLNRIAFGHFFLYGASKALLTLVLAFVAIRGIFAFASLCHASYESWTQGAAFALLAVVVSAGPGLFLWSRLGMETDNPYLPPVFIVASSLGCTMIAAWLLYLCGVFTAPVAICLLVAWMALGIFGLIQCGPSLWRAAVRARIFPMEALALSVSLLFCEGMFECVAGTPMTAWDALVSWDKWAADIAARSGLGGYVSGGYPPGLPLLSGLFYKVLLSDGAESATSLVHLLLSGFLQLFPLLLVLSLVAVSRSLKTNALWCVSLVFGSGLIVRNIVKFVGYTDIPLTAFGVAALAVILVLRESEGLSRGRILAAAVSVLFPVAFVKGNGFIALAPATIAATALWFRGRDRNWIPALWIVLLGASVFYLHQWTFGVWTSWGETSPFHHSLAVMSSHKELVQPTGSHLREILSQFCSAYGFGSGIPWMVGFTGSLALSFGVALGMRKTRAPAVFVLLLLVAWFHWGSYDERNVLLVLALAAVLVPHGWTEALRSRRRAYVALLCLVLPVCVYSMAGTRVSEIASVCFRRYAVPSSVSETPDERTLHALKMPAERFAYFAESPAAARASHILVYPFGSRYLRGKGVYPLQNNAYREGAPHDLAIANGPFVPKAPYVPVSGLAGCSAFGDRLFVAEPTMVPVPFEIEGMPDHPSIRVPRTEGMPDCGFVSVTWDGPAEGLVVGVAEPESLAGPVFRPYESGNVVRLGYWVRRDFAALRIELHPGCGRTVEKVEVGY